MSGRVHTVYRVTVRADRGTLIDYVIAAPTEKHAIAAVEAQTGNRALMWQPITDRKNGETL